MIIAYVRAKIDWLTRGKRGSQPDFGNYVKERSRIKGRPALENTGSGAQRHRNSAPRT